MNKQESKRSTTSTSSLVPETIPKAILQYKIRSYLDECQVRTEEAKACVYKKVELKNQKGEIETCAGYCEEHFEKWFPSLLMKFNQSTKSIMPRIPRLLFKRNSPLGAGTAGTITLQPEKVILTCYFEVNGDIPSHELPPKVHTKFYFIWEEKDYFKWKINFTPKRIGTSLESKEELKAEHVKEFLSIYKELKNKDYSKYEEYEIFFSIVHTLIFKEINATQLEDLIDNSLTYLVDSVGREIMPGIGDVQWDSRYSQEKQVSKYRSWILRSSEDDQLKEKGKEKEEEEEGKKEVK